MSSIIVPNSVVDETRILKVLAHAAMGRRVLPTAWIEDGRCSCAKGSPSGIICTHGHKMGKHALLTEWQHRATTDPDEIIDWYRHWPRCNWGWLQDKTFALDVDPKRGGLESLARWEEEADGPNATLTQRTQSGGWHFIYRQPGGGGMATEGDVQPGIEVRATRTYIMIEPSVGLDGAWTLVDPDAPIADADDFVLKLIATHCIHLGDGVERRGGSGKKSSGKKSSGKTSSLPPTEYFVKNGFGDYTGSRNKDAYALSWRLLRHGDSKPDMYTTSRIAGIMKTCWLATDQGDAPFAWDECLGALQSAYRRKTKQDKEDAAEQAKMAASLTAGAL